MTARDCPVCAHPRRDDVDAALHEGQQPAQVANRHWLRPADLQRHADEHLAPAEPAVRPAAHPLHGAAVLEAWRRRAEAEGVYVPTAARNWRHRVGWTGPGAA